MDIFGWISQQDASALVIGAGILAAAFTAIGVALKPIIRSRPARGLGAALGTIGRVLIGDPLAKVVHRALDEWARTEGGPVDKIDRRLASLEEQNVRNGGSTNRDRLNAIARAVDADPDPVSHPPIAAHGLDT